MTMPRTNAGIRFMRAEAASSHGGQIDAMIGWVHVFMLILFVGWGTFFAYCLVRFRRSRHPVANYTGVKSHTSSYLEVGVAVVEAVLLFGFAIPLWAARVGDMPPAKDALLILLSAALAVLFGVWCLGQYSRQDGVASLVAAVTAFAVSCGLVVYDSWFLRKTRTLR